MVHGSADTVAFRLWPPVAIGVPLLIGWLATLLWGDPADLGGWSATDAERRVRGCVRPDLEDAIRCAARHVPDVATSGEWHDVGVALG